MRAMLPIVGVPPTLTRLLSNYRDLFCRHQGFAHVGRYLTGLLLCPNQTLQGIHAQQTWLDQAPVSRRAMHAAVFAARWDDAALMSRHRAVVTAEHRRRGREVIALDSTLAHHERARQMFGVKRRYDYVEKRMSRPQILITATVANRDYIDGIEVAVQRPQYEAEERQYLRMTARDSYEHLEQVRARLVELLHYQMNR